MVFGKLEKRKGVGSEALVKVDVIGSRRDVDSEIAVKVERVNW